MALLRMMVIVIKLRSTHRGRAIWLFGVDILSVQAQALKIRARRFADIKERPSPLSHTVRCGVLIGVMDRDYCKRPGCRQAGVLEKRTHPDFIVIGQPIGFSL